MTKYLLFVMNFLHGDRSEDYALKLHKLLNNPPVGIPQPVVDEVNKMLTFFSHGTTPKVRYKFVRKIYKDYLRRPPPLTPPSSPSSLPPSSPPSSPSSLPPSSPPSPLDSSPDSILAKFVAYTGLMPSTAEIFLKDAMWNYDIAMYNYMRCRDDGTLDASNFR